MMNNAMPTIAEIELSAKSSDYKGLLISEHEKRTPPGAHEIRSPQFLVSTIIKKGLFNTCFTEGDSWYEGILDG